MTSQTEQLLTDPSVNVTSQTSPLSAWCKYDFADVAAVDSLPCWKHDFAGLAAVDCGANMISQSSPLLAVLHL